MKSSACVALLLVSSIGYLPKTRYILHLQGTSTLTGVALEELAGDSVRVSGMAYEDFYPEATFPEHGRWVRVADIESITDVREATLRVNTTEEETYKLTDWSILPDGSLTGRGFQILYHDVPFEGTLTRDRIGSIQLERISYLWPAIGYGAALGTLVGCATASLLDQMDRDALIGTLAGTMIGTGIGGLAGLAMRASGHGATIDLSRLSLRERRLVIKGLIEGQRAGTDLPSAFPLSDP